jgi:hypothetical protein
MTPSLIPSPSQYLAPWLECTQLSTIVLYISYFPNHLPIESMSIAIEGKGASRACRANLEERSLPVCNTKSDISVKVNDGTTGQATYNKNNVKSNFFCIGDGKPILLRSSVLPAVIVNELMLLAMICAVVQR